jgi:hypothetical protein
MIRARADRVGKEVVALMGLLLTAQVIHKYIQPDSPCLSVQLRVSRKNDLGRRGHLV